MRIVRLSMRNFRSYAAADVELGPGVTVVTGRNGAGKTNLLDALYFGCTGRSARTTNERELVRFGERVVRVEVTTEAPDGLHELSVGFTPGEPKRMIADGVRVERLLDVPGRPLVSVFLPDRLELIKGTPSLRRAHMDQLVAALWPARVATRRAYNQALAQRNALVARIRADGAALDSLSAWDRELARHGIALMADRSAAVELVAERFAARAEELGLDGDPTVAYRAALEGRRRGRARGRAGGAPGAGRRARLHRPRAASRRPAADARGARAARLRLAGPAAARAARAAAGRARGDRRHARGDAGDAARRRDERAGPRSPRAARRPAARPRAERDHDDRPRPRAGRRGARRDASVDRRRHRPRGGAA